MTVSIWQDRPEWTGGSEKLRESCDVCIVGAGIVGASLATFLHAAGKSVILLDAGAVAGGASGRNAGHCIAPFRRDYHLAIEKFGRSTARNVRAKFEESRVLVRDWLAKYNVPFEATGSQYLGIDPAECEVMRKSAQALRADGFDVEFSEGDPLHAGFHGRLFQPGDIGMNPYLLVCRMLENSGAGVYENAEVRHFEQHGDKVTVNAGRVTVECNHVVLATNAYSSRVHPYFRGTVQPVRAQMYATEPTSTRTVTLPTGTEDGFEYFRQLPDGRFLIGGYRDRFLSEEVGFADETTPHLQAGLESWVREHFPEMAKLKITHRWSGVMGFTADGLPIIGRLPDMPNVYFAVGFTGQGMSAGPGAALIAADCIVSGKEPPAEFRASRLER